MKILLSGNKEIIKNYINEKATIGFIPTASELDNLKNSINIILSTILLVIAY